MSRRYVVFGAHPDDCDLMFGGTAVKLIRAGHEVTFVSVTNGDAGHQSMGHEELAARRLEEARASGRQLGLSDYVVMNQHDGRLENTLAVREEITRIIRRIQPDLVLTHRTCDYHPDHRITAQLVLDSSFLLRVPLFCEDTSVPERNPVFGHCWDPFTDPRPFRADAWSDVTEVMEVRYRALDCHRSQFYEWLPWVNWNLTDFDATGWNWERRRDWLARNWGQMFREEASLVPGKTGGFAEVFEFCPYGAPVSQEEFQRLFEG